MIQDGHSERQELVAEMTVRLGKSFEHLCRRAVDQGLEYPLELSYYILNLTPKIVGIPNLIEEASFPESTSILEHWSDCVFAGELSRLANAFQADHPLKQHPLSHQGSAKSTTRRYQPKINNTFLLNLLIHPLSPCDDEEVFSLRRAIRLWLVLQSADRVVRYQNTADAHIAGAASFLMLDERDEKWDLIDRILHSVKTQLQNRSGNYLQFTNAIKNATKRVRPKTKARSGRQFLNNLQSIAEGHNRALEIRLGSVTNIRHLGWQYAPIESKATFEFDGSRFEVLPAPSDGDESGNDSLLVEVDPTDTPAEQAISSRSVLIQSVELAHYLPWSWNRLAPPEIQAVDQWVARKFIVPELSERLGGAFVWLALKLSRTLAFVERISIGDISSDEWSFAKDFNLLRRAAPRKHSGWKPDEITRNLVHPVDEVLELEVPGFIRSVLLQATEGSEIGASTLGQLWASYHKVSSEQWFNRCSESLMARTKSGMLANRAPQCVFDDTADSRFARLLASHPSSALPGACSYGSWDVKAIEKGLGLSVQNRDNKASDLNLIGSRLVPFESVLMEEVQSAIRKLNLAREKSFSSYHNALAQYVVMALYAATGARPLRDPFESPAFFNLDAGCVYVIDKTDDELHVGRLIPLPEKARALVRVYRNHLLAFSRSVLEHRPELASSLETMANGNAASMPFFFLLDRQLKWHSMAEAEQLDGSLFEWTLPSNLFRHRYAQQLSNRGIDAELIEAWMGHSERGVGTYGDFSPRCWSADAAESMDSLNAVFERLEFEIPSDSNTRPPPLLSVPAGGGYREPSVFGLKQRARLRKARLRKAIREAQEDIDLFLDERSIDELQPDELKQLINQMLLRPDKMPHPQASIRYRILAKVVERSSLDANQKFRKRIIALRQEQSQLSGKVAQSLALFPVIQKWADEARSAVQKSGLTKSKALVVGCLLLAVEKRISYKRLLQDVSQGQHCRIVQHGRQIYLEYSETLTPSNFRAPVQRHEISYKTASLLAYGLELTSKVAEPSVESIQEMAALAELHREHHGTTISRVSEIIHWISDIVDQCNLVHLPGMVAGALSGRVPPTSASWSDTLRLTEQTFVKRPDDNQNLTDEQTKIRIKPGIRLELDKLRLQQQAVIFKDAVYGALKQYEQTSRKAEQTARIIEKLCHENRNTLSSAMLLLGYWMVDLIHAGKGKKGQALKPYAESSLRDYWSAVSGPFAGLAYSVDLVALDEDDLTELCAGMLDYKRQSSKSNRYFGERLIHFFRWAQQFGVIGPDWSELDIDTQERTVSPGLISLDDYRTTQSCIAQDQGLSRDQKLMMGFMLLCSYRFGLRAWEALALQRRDWQEQSGMLWVLVQNNQYRKLKSASSRRVVPLLSKLDESERQLIEQLLGRYESICGNQTNRPILCELQDKKQPGLAEQSANLSAGLIVAIRAMTQNQDLVLHHLRHTFFNRIAAVLLNLESPTAQALTEDLDGPAVRQCVLGSNTACSRRVAMALARLMGHRSPRTGLLNYFHLLTEWADFLTPVASDRIRRLKNASNIDQWPNAPQPAAPPLPAEMDYPELTLERMFQAARLASLGHTFERAGALVELHPSVVKRMEKVLAEANKRQTFKLSLPGGKEQWVEGSEVANALLSFITPSAWQRVLKHARQIRHSDVESIKTVKLPELPILISRRRHVVLDEKSHARFIRQFVIRYAIPDSQLTVVARFDDPDMIRLMINAGFAVQSEKYIAVAEKENQRSRKTKPWTVEKHFLHGFPIITRRRSRYGFGEIILQQSSTGVLRNGHELAVALLIFGVYCRLIKKDKKRALG
ncbi:site-specific integrase [Marinobacter orientalis]|uniref:Site-specific integrase n=1 Tax=Marinobacter orientalis TaxID=1928859 RepID=A0A7Y0RC26_9GAMM|nr:site-specific integrase [Marinobacter orientalis]NMT63484.1 site-specific integrase [Marinobacter orientalis]TGX48545.1 site-specific integrase [Marinobacter orientalis]